MFANLTGWHALLILAVVLLLFGAPKIPALARSLGQSLRIFKTEIKENDAPSEAAPVATQAPAPEVRP
jgi:sec-independent protein translocase protein TatA